MFTSKPTSRRTFLQSGALIAALSPKALMGQSTPGGDIDAHVHVWTPDTRRYPISEGFSKQKDMVPASFTPEELFAHTQPNAITRVVLIQMSFYKFDNRYMLDCMASHKGVFSGVAIIDESREDACETLRSLHSKGVRGIRLYTDKDAAESWPRSAQMKRLWTCAADLGVAMCLLANPDALPAVDGMCKAFPKTRVVIDHFARIGMNGQVQTKDLDALCTLSKSENTYVKTSAFYALGAKKAPYTDLAPMIQKLVAEFGAPRLMWASDCPYQVQQEHTYEASVGLIRTRLPFLSPEDKSWLMRKTAEKVFFT